jgi:hypothetical protein
MTEVTEDHILRRIAEGDLDGLAECLAAYAGETGTINPTSVSRAAAFLQIALVEARAHRAHYNTQRAELEVVRKYMECAAGSDEHVEIIG